MAKLDDNTKEFLRGLSDLMIKHGKMIGVDIDECGGTTDGIFVANYDMHQSNPITLNEHQSYLEAVDIAEVLLDDKDPL